MPMARPCACRPVRWPARPPPVPQQSLLAATPTPVLTRAPKTTQRAKEEEEEKTEGEPQCRLRLRLCPFPGSGCGVMCAGAARWAAAGLRAAAAALAPALGEREREKERRRARGEGRRSRETANREFSEQRSFCKGPLRGAKLPLAVHASGVTACKGMANICTAKSGISDAREEKP